MLNESFEFSCTYKILVQFTDDKIEFLFLFTYLNDN